VHTPTLVLMAVILTGVMALMMLAAWRFNPRTRAMAHWMVAYGCAFAFSLSLLLHRFLPEIVVILLSQSLAAAMAYCNLTGAQLYTRSRRWSWRILLAALAVLLSCSALANWLFADQTIRYLTSSLTVGGLFVASAVTMLPASITLYPARALYALVCALHGAFVMARPWLFQLSESGLFSRDGLIAVSHLVALESIVAIVLLALCVIMLSSEQMLLELRHIAERDALTGVFNRRAFLTLLRKNAAQLGRLNKPLSILLVDLDHFKRINDNAGHKTGDKALRHFIHIAQGCIREGDVIGRIGGEEFAIFLPTADLAEAHVVAQRLRGSLEAHPLAYKHSRIGITASIGIASKLPDESVEEALHRADKAMYRAKRNGRNRVETAANDEVTVLIAPL